MRFDNRIVDQVQSSNDIVDVISQVVPLKKAGRNFKGRCPFHEEKTPSFMVSAEKQIYHCFGCGAGGNVFGFLMQYENLNFPEALRRLADRAHITLPEKSEFRKEEQSEQEKVYEAYQHAAQYYRDIFLDSAQGKTARDYFLKRGFDLELAEEFQVGWAPDAWRGLFEHLSKKGFSQSLLLKARLINQSEKGNVYDVFRGRLMFPIWNLQGKVVAFGGRIIAESEGPKYLNSPENPVFIKRRELFGLHSAKKFLNRDFPRILIAEGYLDLLRLYQKGFKTAVATLGTSLTEEHVTVLKRFAEEAVVVYDGDKAGEAASLRGLEIFLEGGLNVRLIRLPDGYDPDDFLLKKSPEEFQKLIDSAQDFFDYKTAVLLERYNRSDSSGLMKITNEALETLVKVDNPVLLDRYFRKLGGMLGVESSSLKQEWQKLKARQSRQSSSRSPENNDVRTGRKAISASEVRGTSAANRRDTDETLLLFFIIDDAKCRESVFAEIKETDFSRADLKSLYRQMLQLQAQIPSWGWPQALNLIEDPELRRQVMAWTEIEWIPTDKQRALKDCLNHFKKKGIQHRLDFLRSEIAKAEAEGAQEHLLKCTTEYQSLLQQIRYKDS